MRSHPTVPQCSGSGVSTEDRHPGVPPALAGQDRCTRSDDYPPQAIAGASRNQIHGRTSARPSATSSATGRAFDSGCAEIQRRRRGHHRFTVSPFHRFAQPASIRKSSRQTRGEFNQSSRVAWSRWIQHADLAVPGHHAGDGRLIGGGSAPTSVDSLLCVTHAP